ncbi:MAG: hypothetical protein IJ744_06185 [Lachnospiraceae bacterium]|nr:hypothetical protein [Lachnospiraceae bacterium]
MQSFVQKVVENYIIFLFFIGLLLFSLIKSGQKSKKKARAVLIMILFSAVIWADYYMIYIDKLPMMMAWIVPAIVLVILILLRRVVFPYRGHCTNCGKRLSITEFLFNDDNLCHACYDKLHPEVIPLPPEEQIRRENEEKKKGWIGWEPEREFVIAFAAKQEPKDYEVLVLDQVHMQKRPGKLSGAIGEIKASENRQAVAVRTIQKEFGLSCEAPECIPECMGKLHFWMPDMNIRFYVYIAREFSGEPKESTEKNPVWIRLKKMKYEQMSMDYPLWLPRMVRGQYLEYYAKCNTEGKIYEDILDLDAERDSTV